MKSTRKRKQFNKKSRKAKKMEKKRTRVKKMRRFRKSGRRFIGGNYDDFMDVINENISNIFTKKGSNVDREKQSDIHMMLRILYNTNIKDKYKYNSKDGEDGEDGEDGKDKKLAITILLKNLSQYLFDNYQKSSENSYNYLENKQIKEIIDTDFNKLLLESDIEYYDKNILSILHTQLRQFYMKYLNNGLAAEALVTKVSDIYKKYLSEDRLKLIKIINIFKNLYKLNITTDESKISSFGLNKKVDEEATKAEAEAMEEVGTVHAEAMAGEAMMQKIMKLPEAERKEKLDQLMAVLDPANQKRVKEQMEAAKGVEGKGVEEMVEKGMVGVEKEAGKRSWWGRKGLSGGGLG